MKQEINKIKDRLVNKLLILTLLNLSLALFFSLMRWYDIGFHPIYIIHSVLYLVLLSISFFQKKLSVEFKSHFLATLYLVLSIAGLYFMAHYSAYFVVFISVSLATILLGKKHAYIYSIIFLLINIVIAWMHLTRKISIQLDLNSYAHLTTVWAIFFVSFLTLFIILIEGFGLFHNELINSVNLKIAASEELDKSETLRRQVFDSSRIPIIVMDADTNEYIDCNKAAIEIYGCTSKEQVLGLTPLGVSAPIQYDGTASSEKALFYIEKAKNEGSVIFEWKHQRPDGVVWDAEVHLISFSVGDKSLLQFSLLNITKRKQAEDKLRESETRYRFITENIIDVIWTMSFKTGKFTYVSTSVEKLRGYTVDEVLNQSMEDALTPESFQIATDLIHQSIAKRISGDISPAINVCLLDQPCKDGSVVSTELVATIIFDEQGQPIEAIGITRDITDRKQAEEELTKNRKMLKLVVESVPMRIFWKDKELNYLGCNALFANDAGLDSPEEIIGKNDKMLAWHKVADLYQNDDIKVINSGVSKLNYEEPQENDLGILKWIETCKVPLLDNNNQTIGVLGTYYDISPRKQSEKELIKAKEKAEESDRLKTAFLQNMSHEIRTPLNAIMGFSSLLSESYNDKEQLEYFSKIIEQRGNDLLDIIGDVLDISKIESGQSTINIENCDINKLFTELGLFFSDYKEKTNKHEINLQFHTSVDKSASHVKTDISKLKQILINLVSNALKFTEIGSINCGYKIENNKLQFYISDTGVGVPSDKYEFIFERFSRIESVISDNLVGGTGLGLSIVKGLVHLLGGNVWLTSEVSKGSTFYFTIDYLKADTPIV